LVVKFSNVASSYLQTKDISDNTQDGTDHAILISSLANAINPGSNRLSNTATDLIRSAVGNKISDKLLSIERTGRSVGLLHPDEVKVIKAAIKRQYEASFKGFKQQYQQTVQKLESQQIPNAWLLVNDYSIDGSIQNEYVKKNLKPITTTSGNKAIINQ
jgi:hypothetical protein